jgi:S1-C subfamily serine protease
MLPLPKRYEENAMTRWIAAAVIGVAALEGVAHTETPTPEPTTCEHCGCVNSPQTNPGGVVNIDSDTPEGPLSGTGIVLTPTGEILTNDHVIHDVTNICVSDDTRAYPAVVVGEDPTHDVALIQLQGTTGLRVAPLGDSSAVKVGDQVTAIGNDGTGFIGSGPVAAINQPVTATGDDGSSEHLDGMIETSGGIVRPGDSGGPLFNASGQVIGVNTAGSTRTGRGMSIGINNALAFVKRFRGGGSS